MLSVHPIAFLTGSSVGLNHGTAPVSITSVHQMVADSASTLLSSSNIIARGGGFVELFFLGRREAAGAGPMLDLSRISMRLEGLQVYATLAALLTNACLELYCSNIRVPKEQEQEVDEKKGSGGGDEKQKTRKLNWSVEGFFACTAVSVLLGSYTTIVFGLLSILSKTALGRGLDVEFMEFWAQSAGIRSSAFESFLGSLICFELSFIMSLFLKLKGRRRKYLVGLASLMFLLSLRRWVSLLRLASKLLFPLYAEVEY
eukprot:scaffold871_cov130-Cylindrotheca_fusiformis.AAC.40